MLGIDRVDQLEDAKSVRFMSMRWTMGIGTYISHLVEMKLQTNINLSRYGFTFSLQIQSTDPHPTFQEHVESNLSFFCLKGTVS
jgi:hypothetical protein